MKDDAFLLVEMIDDVDVPVEVSSALVLTMGVAELFIGTELSTNPAPALPCPPAIRPKPKLATDEMRMTSTTRIFFGNGSDLRCLLDF